MLKWIAGLVVVVLAVVMVPAAVSQMESAPIVYTYVSQFAVPRAEYLRRLQAARDQTVDLRGLAVSAD